MYQPVKPITLEKSVKEDPRSVHGPPIVSARVRPSKKQHELELDLFVSEDKHIIYWKPKEITNVNTSRDNTKRTKQTKKRKRKV